MVSELLSRKTVKSIVATDLSASSLAILRDRFGNDERLETEVWNAEDPPSASLMRNKFDTIICSNVLEHIEDHEKALRHMRQLLKPNGKLAILVPAKPSIYSGLDEELGHFRRYSTSELRRVLEAAGCKVELIIDHNLVGAIGWWWVGKVKGRRTLRAKETTIFDKLVPILKPIDGYLARLLGGVSVIAISSVASEEAAAARNDCSGGAGQAH